MATAALTGSGVQYTDRRDFYLKPKSFSELWPNVTPFTSTLAMGKQKPSDTVYKMFQHEGQWRKQYFDNNGSTVTVDENNADSAAITIDGINGLAASADESYLGMIIECWDSTLTTRRGSAVITAVPSTTTIKVRNLSGDTDIDTVTNDRWYVLAQLGGEGASAPEAFSDELSVVWNATSEYRVSVEISDKLRKAALRGAPQELLRLNHDKLQQFKIQQERLGLFGDSPVGTNLDASETFTDSTGNDFAWRTDAEGNALRTGVGACRAVDKYGASSGDDQSVFTVAEASFEWSDYVDISSKMFQYLPNSGFKRAYCGMGALNVYSRASRSGLMGNSDWKVVMTDFKRDKIGFNYRMLETPAGLLQLIYAPVFDGPRAKWMLSLDMDEVSMAVYEANAFHQDIKTDNRPTIQKNEYSGDMGPAMTNVKKHHLIKFV